jgi:hypothetical protein
VTPFGPFEPDRSIYYPGVTTNAVNCLPVADGWGPQPDLVAISDALGAECVGAVYVRTTAGAFRLIAGTATALYELNLTDYSWTVLTRLVGGAYGVPVGDGWCFNIYGTSLIATNITDDPQVLDIDSGVNFAALGGSPPKVKYSCNSGEFLVLLHHAGFPNRVMTSGIGDAGYWTVGQRGCDFQDFPDGEEIMGGIGSEKGAIIFQRSLIRQMVIAQAGDFSFMTQIVNPNRGVVAARSIAQIGPGQFFYYSADGFMLGAEGKPIGAERVDAWFGARVDPQKIGRIRSVADPFEKIVWTQGEEASGSKFFIGYNWQLERWCSSDAMMSEMAVMVTPGISIDGLDDLYASIDDVTEPFDSGLFTGGLPRFAAFDTDHRLGFFTGTARAATIDTADLELNPGFRTLIDPVRVYTDATDFTLRAITSNTHGGARTVGTAKSPNSRSGLAHLRSDARLQAIRVEIPAGASWKHVIGVEPEDARRTGKV